MRDYTKFYIDGAWVDPITPATLDVENPATEETAGVISLGSKADVDVAVKAARRAFGTWQFSTKADRLDVLRAMQSEYEKRQGDLADAVTEEMGAPSFLATGAHARMGAVHLANTIEQLTHFEFDEQRGDTIIAKEPIGVCGLITPWNWPINQISVKVYPALATGCTMVLKPSEIAPFSAQIFAEIVHAAGVPAGVFNMINGDGPGVGSALSGHPDVDFISFTGSTRAGIEVAKNAALTVKRVAQELGGKSPNILLDDSAFAKNVSKGVASMMNNTGQTCTAPSRMLVPAARMEEAKTVAKEAADQVVTGDPTGNVKMGPLVSRTQFDKVQGLIEKGIEEGATLVAGGPGKPDGIEIGHFARPTVFADVTNDMTIAREEIFGPVLTILGYESIEQAVQIANDTLYGLAGQVAGEDLEQARKIARQIKAGRVSVNGGVDMAAPFGGYKQSGNGREWGIEGFHEFLEIKAMMGYGQDSEAAE